MPSDMESLVIGGVEVNSESGPWRIHNGRLENNPPLRRPTWLDNPDADGGILDSIPRLERQTINVQIELVDAADMDEALDSLLALIAVLDEAERLIPGQWVTRTPANTDRTRLTYCQLGEITNLPVERSGELAGWLEARPVVVIRLECVPYWLGTLQTGTPVTNGDPIQVATVTPEGNLPAFGFVRYTDTETADRSHVEIGADHTDDTSRSYLIDSASLTALGGSASTESGAYSASGTIAASLVDTPLAICGHTTNDIGSFKVKVRVKETTGTVTGTASLRVDVRAGDGPFSEGSWVELGTGDFYELDLGSVEFPESPLGDQDCEIRIVGKADTLSVVEVDYVVLMPTSAFYSVARAPLRIPTSSTFVGLDTFDQTSGALNGKTSNTGGNWASTGGSPDFQVSGSGTVTRVGSSETTRTALLGALSYADIAVSMTFSAAADYAVISLLGRYVDANNSVRVQLSEPAGTRNFAIAKTVGGTVSYPAQQTLPTPLTSGPHSLLLLIRGNSVAAWLFTSGSPVASLAASLGGTSSAAGGVGFSDSNSGSAGARTFYDFAAYVPANEPALYSGRSLELRHDRALRESSDGTTWGRPPIHRGGYALLPPGLSTRVVAKARRNDIDGGLPDSTIDDTGTLAVDHIPRYSVVA